MKIFNHLLLILVCTGVHAGFCQFSKLDTERKAVYTAATDKERLTHLLSMSKLKNSMHGDTIYYYAQWAKRLAIQLKDDKALAWAEYNLISSDLAKGNPDSVIKKIDDGTIFNNIKKTDTALYYKVQLLKANALNRIDKRTEALELQLKLLTEAEKENNTNARLFALNFIGATYLNVNKLEDAKQSWLKGLQIIREKNNTENDEIEAYILSNLALYYFNIYAYQPSRQLADSFFITVNKTISLSAQNENLGVLASAFSLRGNFYGLIKNFTAGEKDFTEGLAIRKKIGDPLYILNDIIGLSNFYLQQKKYAQSIQTAEQGFTIFEKGQVKGAEQLQLIGLMGAAYKAMGDYKNYSNFLERFLKVADSRKLL
jgi:tetratricopeptide (TPR) repeat protein